jgi:LemA protein
MKAFVISLVAIILLGGAYFFLEYNGLVAANERIDGQWAQVESQYQRRFDLVPNLVASVKGAMDQEQAVFGEIAEARTRYSGANTVNEKVTAANELEGALGRLLVIIENYPQLRSIETVQTLMTQLKGTENRISVERMRFNELVEKFNIKIKRLPTAWIADWIGFAPRAYFEAAEGADTAPVVDLSN